MGLDVYMLGHSTHMSPDLFVSELLFVFAKSKSFVVNFSVKMKYSVQNFFTRNELIIVLNI